MPAIPLGPGSQLNALINKLLLTPAAMNKLIKVSQEMTDINKAFQGYDAAIFASQSKK